MLTKEDYIKRISISLSHLESYININNQNGLNDVNTTAQSFFCDLLNRISPDWNLEDLDVTVKPNYPAIDLAGFESRIAVQVTSDNSYDKVKKTVDKFIAHELHKKFDRLIVLHIGREAQFRKKKYGQTEVFELDIKDDVWNRPRLLREIRKLKPEQLSDLSVFLESSIQTRQSLAASPIPAINGIIESELKKLKKNQFFINHDLPNRATAFAFRLDGGDLTAGDPKIKEEALGWCAVALCDKDPDLSKSMLSLCIATQDSELFRLSKAIVDGKVDINKNALKQICDLNSPLAYTAKLIISSVSKDDAGTLEWFDNSGLAFADFDTEGKMRLLQLCIEVDDASRGIKLAEDITEEDLDVCPFLLYVLGKFYLRQAIPLGKRKNVLPGLPLNFKEYPVCTTVEDQNNLLKASQYFKRCEAYARANEHHIFANEVREIYVWIELRNPATYQLGIRRLKDLLASNDAMRFVKIAVQFGLEIDIDSAQTKIDQHINREASITYSIAMAITALIDLQSSPSDSLQYFRKYRAYLQEHIDPGSFAGLEVRLLCEDGRLTEAKQIIDELAQLPANSDIVAVCRQMVAAVSSPDPTDSLIEAYQNNQTPDNLMSIVLTLTANKNWPLLRGYAETLFDRLGTLDSLERYALALHKIGESETLNSLLEDWEDLTDQSVFLRRLKADALFMAGKFNEAWKLAEEIRRSDDDKNIQDLAINIAINMGNWDWVGSFIERAWAQRDTSSAEELIQIARLSHTIGHSRSVDLVKEAVKKSDNSAQIYSDAYFISVQEGWEDDILARDWLMKAVEHSGESGPLKNVSFEELMDLQSKHTNELSQMWDDLKLARIPLFAAGMQTNKTLCEMILIASLANQEQGDVRKKGFVRVYSSNPATRPIKATKIAIEGTGLITLALCNSLNKLTDSFDEIVIPHHTLHWLLSEKSRVEFHQPSALKKARKLQSLLTAKKLTASTPSSDFRSDLIPLVGKNLASFLSTASKYNDVNNPHIVVLHGDVHKAGSLMKETVDLSEYSRVISSCSDIIAYLLSTGFITQKKAEEAYDFLKAQNDPGLSDVPIKSGTHIYLDYVSVSYFQTLGVLEFLSDAGLFPYIDGFQMEEMESLLQYKSYSTEALKKIEEIRRFLAQGIEDGKVKVAPQGKIDHLDKLEFRLHPSISIVDCAPHVEAIVIDDPFINKHPVFQYEDQSVPVYTSWDLLEHFVLSGKTSEEDADTTRHLLRKSGYVAILPSIDELRRLINITVLQGDGLRETAELRAIRENLTHLQIFSALSLPDAFPFVAQLQKNFQEVMIEQWNSDEDIELVKARSSWLLDQMGYRRWLQAYPFEMGSKLARSLEILFAQTLTTGLRFASVAKQQAYFNWLENQFLDRMQFEEPELYDDYITAIESSIIEAVSKALE